MADDLFALLGEARRPFLDPERIKDRFHELSRSQHPDQHGGEDASGVEFARLNGAQATLRDPKARLRHLLELEYPQARLTGPTTVPGALADLFAPVHGLLQEIDALLAKKAAATSALARAVLARPEMALREEAERRLATLDGLHMTALADLKAFDRRWEPRPPDAEDRLRDFYQRFSYLSRWIEQLRERLFQLGA